MLSCFGRPRAKGDEHGGKRRRRRLFEAVFSEAHSRSDLTHGSMAAAVQLQQPQLVSLQQHPGDSKVDTPLSDGGSAVWQQPSECDAAPQPATPPPSLPRITRQQQPGQQQQQQHHHREVQAQPLQQVTSPQEPLRQPPPIAVARPSWASEGSSLDNAAWVAGARRRHGRGGDSSAISDSSFTSARSSFSSQVSGPASDAVSGFWPPYRDSGSAGPSTRGGSEEGSPRPPRPQIKRPSWYLAQFGPDYATLDDLKAASGELGQAAALAIGWQQDGAADSESLSGDSSQLGEASGRRADRAVSWPHQQLPSLDPQLPDMSRNVSWAGGRCEDDAASEASAGSAASVQELLNQAEAAFADGRLLHVRELLRQAAARHGCSFRELLADGAAAAFGTGVTCFLDLQQLGLELALIRRSLSDAQDLSGYETSCDNDLRVLYRHIKGSGAHSFRFEATYDCPLSHMLALTREFDLLGTWNRMALDPAILAEPSIFANVIYTGQWMPFPLTAVDMVVRSNWSDLLEEEGAMLVTMADHSEHAPGEDLKPLPRRASRRRRIQLLAGSSSILQPYPCTEDGRQRCRCAVLAHLNPHVPHVPGFLITFVLKVMSPFIFNATRDMLASSFKSPDMELPRRMAANPQLYAKVEERFRSPPFGTPPPLPPGRSLATSFRNL